MSDETLKGFMDEQKEINRGKTDEEVFESLQLTEKDLDILKYTSLPKETTISALINLILRDKLGKSIKEENKTELVVRGFITEDGEITESGRTHIETNDVKHKIQKLLNGK